MRRRLWLLWLLPLLAGGCVTHKLWSEKTLDEWNEPAPSPNLRLFRDAGREDFLVIYDEFANRHSRTNTRAFFLFQNRQSLDQQARPLFVGTNLAGHLPSVPVFFAEMTHPPEPFYAVTTHGGNFTLVSNGFKSGPYSLPLYSDGVGKVERMAWTPVTVTADLTIVGGFLALLLWDALAESGTTISAP